MNLFEAKFIDARGEDKSDLGASLDDIAEVAEVVSEVVGVIDEGRDGPNKRPGDLDRGRGRAGPGDPGGFEDEPSGLVTEGDRIGGNAASRQDRANFGVTPPIADDDRAGAGGDGSPSVRHGGLGDPIGVGAFAENLEAVLIEHRRQHVQGRLQVAAMGRSLDREAVGQHQAEPRLPAVARPKGPVAIEPKARRAVPPQQVEPSVGGARPIVLEHGVEP